MVDGRDQPSHSCRNQVVEGDVPRHTLLNPPGDQPDLWQVFQDQPSRSSVLINLGDGIVGHVYLQPGEQRPWRKLEAMHW
jgi:hypothetical protein